MRLLTKDEQDLIRFMLTNNGTQKKFIDELPNLMVEEMNDGGMGSLRFLSKKEGRRVFKNEISIMHYRDTDGVSVRFALNLDQDDEVYELDVFKGDFSAMKKFPVAPYPSLELGALGI